MAISTGNNNDIFALLRQTPPNLLLLEMELQRGAYSSEDMARAMLQYLDDCFADQFEDETVRSVEPVIEPEKRSASLLDVTKIFLAYGLDPNAVVNEKSILRAVCYIDNGYLAADTLALLFENGGRPDVQTDGSTLFSDIDFDVIFDAANQEDRRRYDALVHCWFVCLGYGAKPAKGEALDVFGGFDVGRLKNHRDYTFALTYTPNCGESWSLHIIERKSFWEVARL